MMWAAVSITIAAASASSVGKSVQKEATRGLPPLSADSRVLRQYLTSRLWVTGLVLDILGGILILQAFSIAPVSLVQPVSSVGLVGLALYSHFVLRELLSGREWLAVASALLGTLGLGVSSPEPDLEAASPHAVRVLSVLGSLLLAVATLAAGRLRSSGRSKRGEGRRGVALLGLTAGALFGLSAGCTRAGFLLAHSFWPAGPLGVAASAGVSSAGFVLQTVGLKQGSAVVVCTCATVAAMTAGTVAGVAALGEPLPSGAALAVVVSSWALILAGVGILASAGGAERWTLPETNRRGATPEPAPSRRAAPEALGGGRRAAGPDARRAAPDPSRRGPSREHSHSSPVSSPTWRNTPPSPYSGAQHLLARTGSGAPFPVKGPQHH